MKRTKIAILADPLDLQNAGIHVYVRGLVSALAELETANEYILVRPKAGGEFPKLRELVIPVNPKITGHQRIRGFFTMPRRLVEEGVEVAVEMAHFGPFNLPKHIRRATLIHDLTPILHPTFHPLGSVWAHRLMLKSILRKADLVLANSKHTEEDVHAYCPATRNKSVVIYPGREKGFFPKMDTGTLKKYGIQQPYLLSVGTLEPRKNLLTLIKAYELFRQRSELKVPLVLVGQSGWKNEGFERMLANSPIREDVFRLGFVPQEDLPVLYSMTQLFVYPSHYEGFGLPVLEAMLCGAPVLLSDVSSLPEVGGAAAAYFDPHSENDLAGQLVHLLGNEALLKIKSEQSVQQAAKFDWKKSALLLDENLSKVGAY